MIAKDEISMEEVESCRCAFRAGPLSLIVERSFFLLVLALLMMQMLKAFTDALPMSP